MSSIHTIFPIIIRSHSQRSEKKNVRRYSVHMLFFYSLTVMLEIENESDFSFPSVFVILREKRKKSSRKNLAHKNDRKASIKSVLLFFVLGGGFS
jgi:hypothetical protein